MFFLTFYSVYNKMLHSKKRNLGNKMKKHNRELTTQDIIGAAEIFVEVNTDRSYPFVIAIPKEKYPKGHKFEYSNLINLDGI